MAHLFVELPDRTMYPDYYEVVGDPICLSQIYSRLHSRSYSTWEMFEAEVQLMIDNARSYNEEGSEVYQNAELLEGVLKKHREKAVHAARASQNSRPPSSIEGEAGTKRAKIASQKASVATASQQNSAPVAERQRRSRRRTRRLDL
eukprot:SAG31_NODE_3419_length_4297_cov_1.545606_4_plen_146_part_00